MKSTRMIEGVAIDEDSAMGDVCGVVVNDAVVMPVVAPVVPSPAKSSKEADSKAEAKSNSRARKKQTWVRIPARPDPNRLTVHEPRIVFRDVNNLRVGGFDHNCLSLVGHLFLRRALDRNPSPARSQSAHRTRAKDRIPGRKQSQGRRVRPQLSVPRGSPFPATCSLSSRPFPHDRALPEPRSSRPALG